VTIAADPAFTVMDLTVDATSVYVANWPSGSRSGSIMKAPFAGGAPIVLAGNEDFPFAVRVDTTSVYWVTQAGSSATAPKLVSRASLDGSGHAVLSSDPAWRPTSMAVDANYVYWANGETTAGHLGSILRVPRSGGATTVLVSGLTNPQGLAVDGSSVYWINNVVPGDAAPFDGTVAKAPLAGGTQTTLATTGTGNQEARVIVDGADLYFMDLAKQALMRVPVAGGAATLVTALGGPAETFALDGANVYWVSRCLIGGVGSNIWLSKVARTGGAPAVLATGLVTSVIAVDSASVYFVARDPTQGWNSLQRVTK
jgi:hypothetical protein